MCFAHVSVQLVFLNKLNKSLTSSTQYRVSQFYFDVEIHQETSSTPTRVCTVNGGGALCCMGPQPCLLLWQSNPTLFNSWVQFFATPWTVAHQAPLSMGFSTQNTGVGCHSQVQGIFLTQGWNLRLLCLRHWQVDFSPLSHLRIGTVVGWAQHKAKDTQSWKLINYYIEE